jgi:hypothetical protein
MPAYVSRFYREIRASPGMAQLNKVAQLMPPEALSSFALISFMIPDKVSEEHSTFSSNPRYAS